MPTFLGRQLTPCYPSVATVRTWDRICGPKHKDAELGLRVECITSRLNAAAPGIPCRSERRSPDG